MPKQRKKQNRSLPAYWRKRYGSYYYRPPIHARHLWDNKTEICLGQNLNDAYSIWLEKMDINPDELSSMNDIFDRYLLEHVPTLSSGGQQSYRTSLRKLRPVFGEMRPHEIEPVHAYRFNDLASKKHGKTSAKHDIQVLRHTLTKAVKWGVTKQNPLIGQLQIENNPPRDRLVEDWEITEFMKVTGHQRRPLDVIKNYVTLKLMTGFRRGDLLSIRLSDIKEDGIHVQPNKTKKSSGKRLIVEWDEQGELFTLIETIKAIPPRRIGNATLFTTKHGKPYAKNSFDSLWGRFMDKVMTQTDVVDRFQERDLRAKVASESASLLEASERLGHASTETTKRIYRRKPVRVSPLIRNPK
ncbi:MAG: tyrosine-type recombinase/integrase [Sulfuriflexus sp.]|nr:tyrosine-type recombinase/integrase [Sulfuriflexus sp.]